MMYITAILWSNEGPTIHLCIFFVDLADKQLLSLSKFVYVYFVLHKLKVIDHRQTKVKGPIFTVHKVVYEWLSQQVRWSFNRSYMSSRNNKITKV